MLSKTSWIAVGLVLLISGMRVNGKILLMEIFHILSGVPESLTIMVAMRIVLFNFKIRDGMMQIVEINGLSSANQMPVQ